MFADDTAFVALNENTQEIITCFLKSSKGIWDKN